VQIVISLVAACVIAYLLGAIPFALIVGKVFYKIDLRERGSGNLGATNVFRVLGWKAGLAVALLDIAKGSVAVLVAVLIYPSLQGPEVRDWVLIVAALSAVLGHSYSPYIRFRGGKGVATAAGALLVITPLAWPILFVSFVLVVYVSRMVSLGSIAMAAAFPFLTLWLYGDRPALVTMSFIAASLVIWRHRSNIVRIWRGNEPKIGREGTGLRDSAIHAYKDSNDDSESGS